MAATYVNGNKVDTWKLGNNQVSVAKLDGNVVYDYASNTETDINITADNYNVTASWVAGLISAAYGGANPPSGSIIHFVVKPGVTLVAASTADSFMIDASWWSGLMKTCGVVLENQGTILGRGGQGGDSNGRSGGDAITAAGMPIVIINKGSIGGGGGAGGGVAGNAVRLRSGGTVTWSVTGTLYGNVG